MSFAEARAVELALALSTPAPVLVSLHEPFSDVALAEPHVVNQRARDLAAAGACVVITTASAADAAAVADRVFVLRGGGFAFDVAADAPLGDRGALAEIVAWVTVGDAGADGVQAFRRGLAGAAGVLGVAWDDPGDGALTVRVRARDGASGRARSSTRRSRRASISRASRRCRRRWPPCAWRPTRCSARAFSGLARPPNAPPAPPVAPPPPSQALPPRDAPPPPAADATAPPAEAP